MEPISEVPGLFIQKNALTPETEQQIIQYIDALGWSNELIRRTIHRGYKYPYRGGSLTPTLPIEGWLLKLAKTLSQAGIFIKDGQKIIPQQCIVNEYLADQGIGAHTDRGDFGPVIVAYSLGCGTNMIFSKNYSSEKIEVYLPPRSIFMMTEECRWKWKHQIPIRNYVNTSDGTINKDDNYRRISITFRTV